MKPSLSVEVVTELLDGLFGRPPERLERLQAEGMESQAFRFEVESGRFVLRINPSLRGFEKDRWASETVGAVVPAVTVLGQLDEEHAYCVTEWRPGATLEDLPVDEARSFVEEVHAAWAGIASSDVSAVGGFGDFDAQGRAVAPSCRGVLLSTFEGWKPDDPVVASYRELVERCPEERALIHGDFGANNVLTHDGRITAVLDWDCAMVGDPLYDVANARFWATHLPCMDVQAEYFDGALGDLPGYGDRLLCYALRIGMEEARESRADDPERSWAWTRCRELLADAR